MALAQCIPYGDFRVLLFCVFCVFAFALKPFSWFPPTEIPSAKQFLQASSTQPSLPARLPASQQPPSSHPRPAPFADKIICPLLPVPVICIWILELQSSTISEQTNKTTTQSHTASLCFHMADHVQAVFWGSYFLKQPVHTFMERFAISEFVL